MLPSCCTYDTDIKGVNVCVEFLHPTIPLIPRCVRILCHCLKAMCNTFLVCLFRSAGCAIEAISLALHSRPSVWHIAVRACEIPRSVSKTVNNFFYYGLHLRPKKSNTSSGDDVRRMCCYVLGCKCKQWWKKLFTVFDTDWGWGRWGGRCFT